MADRIPLAPDFIEAVMKKLGVDGPTGLTRRMNWDINTPSLIGKWRKGTTAPSYEPVMEMLAECGWLNMTGDVRELPQRTRDPLEDLKGTVDRQGAATTRALHGLEARLEHIRDLLEPPDQEAIEETKS